MYVNLLHKIFMKLNFVILEEWNYEMLNFHKIEDFFVHSTHNSACHAMACIRTYWSLQISFIASKPLFSWRIFTALIQAQIHILYLKLCGKYYLASTGTQKELYIAHFIDQNRHRKCGNQITYQYFVGQIKQAPSPHYLSINPPPCPLQYGVPQTW